MYNMLNVVKAFKAKTVMTSNASRFSTQTDTATVSGDITNFSQSHSLTSKYSAVLRSTSLLCKVLNAHRHEHSNVTS